MLDENLLFTMRRSLWKLVDPNAFPIQILLLSADFMTRFFLCRVCLHGTVRPTSCIYVLVQTPHDRRKRPVLCHCGCNWHKSTQKPGNFDVVVLYWRACFHCMHVWSSHKAMLDQPKNKVVNPARRGRMNTNSSLRLPCLHLCLRIWPRETVSAIPSRANQLILHTEVESGAYSRDPSRFPRRRPITSTAIHHRVSPEFIGSRN